MTITDLAPADTRKRAPKSVPGESFKPKKEHPYYNFGQLLSYNGVFNFLAGARGLGKTFGAKEKGIKDFLKNGDQFIYLRRYKTELKAAATFFADIEYLFPDWEFRVNGHQFECSPMSEAANKKRKWDIMGYVVALSTSQNLKSIAYPRVKLIIYDEFILEKGNVQYISNEVDVFLNFYNTVDRGQDKTRVLFLANAVSIDTPFFIEYKIDPAKAEFQRFFDGFIVVHIPRSEEFAASMRNTRFGKFISETDYARYAIDNEFRDNNGTMVKRKDSSSRYLLSIETRRGTFSIWSNAIAGVYYAQEKQPGNTTMVTLIRDRVTTEKPLMEFSDMFLSNLRTAWKKGKVYFDHDATRNAFIEILNRR